jgi:hypothetical protein
MKQTEYADEQNTNQDVTQRHVENIHHTPTKTPNSDVTSNSKPEHIEDQTQNGRRASEDKNGFDGTSFKQLPLTWVEVSMPQVQDSLVTQHYSYPIKYLWNGKPLEISRRYSVIEQLRKTLRLFLPYSFIIPVHKKQIIVF